jgi:hypothetical protein
MLLPTVYAAAATASLKTNVTVLCCLSSSSYAKADGDASACFQHVRPGTIAADCATTPDASGYCIQGPCASKLFLATSSSSCTNSVQVGTASMMCLEGEDAKKVRLTIVTSAPHR